MAAPNEYYVRPTNGNDTTGDGLSHATAWQTINKAIATISRDATDGDRINLCDESTATFSGTESLNGTGGAPWVVQGYTTTAGDGGIGVISGGGTTGLFSNTTGNSTIFRDLQMGNTGANDIVIMDDFVKFENVYFHDTSTDAIDCDHHVAVVNCRFESITGVAIRAFTGSVFGCYFNGGFTDAIIMNGILEKNIAFNIFTLSGTADGFVGSGAVTDPQTIIHNSFFHSGTGAAIDITDATGAGIAAYILNNVIEGFTTGIDLSAATAISMAFVAGNAGYDNGTNFTLGDIIVTDDNEALGASPFSKSGSDTYANRATYFQSVDTGNMRSPYGSLAAAKGAVQTVATGGGGVGLIGGGLVHA